MSMISHKNRFVDNLSWTYKESHMDLPFINPSKEYLEGGRYVIVKVSNQATFMDVNTEGF